MNFAAFLKGVFDCGTSRNHAGNRSTCTAGTIFEAMRGTKKPFDPSLICARSLLALSALYGQVPDQAELFVALRRELVKEPGPHRLLQPLPTTTTTKTTTLRPCHQLPET